MSIAEQLSNEEIDQFVSRWQINTSPENQLKFWGVVELLKNEKELAGTRIFDLLLSKVPDDLKKDLDTMLMTLHRNNFINLFHYYNIRDGKDTYQNRRVITIFGSFNGLYDKLYSEFGVTLRQTKKDLVSNLSYDLKRGVLSLNDKPIYKPQRTKGRKQILDELWKSRSRPKTNMAGSINLKQILADIGNFKSDKGVDEAIEDIRIKLKKANAPARIDCNRGYTLIITD